MLSYLSENIWYVLLVLLFFMVYFYPNSFQFFFIRPRQKELDRKFSCEVSAYKAESERISKDVESLISILNATKSEVSLSMDIAKDQLPFDSESFPSDVNPQVVSVLVPFMKKKYDLSFPVLVKFHPTPIQRRIGFAVHLLLSLALVIGLFFLSAPLRADSTTAAKDSSLVSVSDTVKERNYVASVNSDKFHVPSCRYADNISDENRVYYDSRGDALSDGKSPCSSCSP